MRLPCLKIAIFTNLSQHPPVLLENAKVGGIVGLIVSVGIVGAHVLSFQHGNCKVQSVATTRGDLLLVRAKSGDLVDSTTFS